MLRLVLFLAIVIFGQMDSNVRMARAAASSGCANVVDTGGGACTSSPVILSPSEQAILARKTALAEEFAAVRASKLSLANFLRDAQAVLQQYGGPTAAQVLLQATPDACTTDCPPVNDSVNLVQQSQANFYYCGPATASEILRVRGVTKSQSFLAGSNYLRTDADGGTNWNPQVMAPTLNTLTNSSWYVAVNGSGVQGGFTNTTYEADLTTDIYLGWPIAGNTVEIANQGPHLIGHPSNLGLNHWIAIYGYTSNGAYTKYADSIAGDAWIWSWAANVPAYSTYDSPDMTTLLNGRGFVW
jgi:hypothetical protein